MSAAVFICMFSLLLSCGGGGDSDSGGASGQSSTITLTSDAPIDGVTDLYTLPADGSSSAVIYAVIRDSSGDAVRHYTEVVFTTTLGHFRNGSTTYTMKTQPPLDKEGFPDPDAAPTGIADVQFIAGTTPGIAKITVTSNGVTQSIYITLTGATGNMPVGEAFSLSAAYLNISGWWMFSLEDTITASAADINGNAVKDGTIIYFKTYNTGGYVEPASAPTGSGKAVSILYSTANPAPSAGFLMLTGETEGDDTTRVTSIVTTPYPDQHIMYAGTNGGGVYKSTDSGNNWVTASRSSENPKRGQNLIEPYIKGHNGIAVDPDNHNSVYVGTGYLGKGNVYRSLDGGNNWNSNNVEQWNGLYETTAAVLTVVADGDDNSSTDYPYVWIGTEGRGPLYATDGKSFQPSGGTATSPVFTGTGNGTMSQPVLSYSSKSETWTTTCAGSTAAASTPSFSGTGNGGMSEVTTSSSTVTETWSVIYRALVGTVTQTGTGNGKVSDIAMTQPNAASETWTLTCTSTGSTISAVTGTATTKGSLTGISVDATHTKTETFTVTCIIPTLGAEVFSVVSDLNNYPNAGPGAPITYSQSGVDFTISAPVDLAEPYALNETFIFTATVGGTFSVCSNVAGCYDDAAVGETYNKDGLTFIIRAGTTAFVVDDAFTFTITTDWRVSGTVSGPQANTVTVGTLYTSDNSQVSFTIWEGTIDYAVGDTFTFRTAGGLTYWTVVGTVSGTQTKLAFANQGYYSDGREVYFEITEGTTPFAISDAFTFAVTANNVNHGWTVWDMVRVPDTHGATAILYAGTATGVYKTTNGAQTWNSAGFFTGDYILALELYPTATGGTTDIIYAGTQNAGVWASPDSGTTWTQYVTGIDSGQGANIKDLLVDPANHRLYAITTSGSVDSATGSVYMHTLNANGTMTADPWVKANTGTSGTALYALGSDMPLSPTALFVGGEGINLYKATSGLDSGTTPTWYESKGDISNLIMARMPVLFSGECFMTIYRTDYGNGYSYFEIYIEDENGNPPLKGSTFTAIATPRTGLTPAPPELTYWDVTYPECYTTPHGASIHGTFRDPSDGATNDPYFVSANGNLYELVTFTFTPTCETEVPGCSGSNQSRTFGLQAQ